MEEDLVELCVVESSSERVFMAEGLVLPATHLQLFISTWLQHTQLERGREGTH